MSKYYKKSEDESTACFNDKQLKIGAILDACDSESVTVTDPIGLRPCLVPKIFQDSSSMQVFERMHGALSIDKK